MTRDEALDVLKRNYPSRCFEDLCKAVDIAIKALSAQQELHYCRECKWSKCYINVDKYGNGETYWRCLNWDGETNEEGYCHEWDRRTKDE